MRLQDGAAVATDLGRRRLPVSRTLRISLMTADGLTSNRSAAWRLELPASTARTIRWRKSWDRGAVIVGSIAPTPVTLESDHPIPCNPETL
jgi:hypothetical protein